MTKNNDTLMPHGLISRDTKSAGNEGPVFQECSFSYSYFASLRNGTRQFVLPALALCLTFAIWEIACRIFEVKEYLLPLPSRVAVVIWHNAPMLLRDFTVTFIEAALGFVFAFTLAFLVAISFTRSRLLEQALLPYLVAFQAVPIIAIGPLLVLWCGNGLLGKVVLAAIICFFPAVVSMTRGLRSVDPDAMMLMRSLSATSGQILLKLRIPSSLPFIFAAMRISATLSVIGALVAEISGATQGIGFRIVISTYRTDTAMQFASLFFAVILGLTFYGAMSFIECLLQKWCPVGNIA